MDNTISVLIAGVGGQGTVLASKLLATAAAEAGFDVRQSEVHGMSQRGGDVTSHVRFGPNVFSPLISTGEADFILAFEKLEALRNIHLLKKGGLAIVNDKKIIPMSVSAGLAEYPKDINEKLKSKPIDLIMFDADTIAIKDVGNIRTVNVILMGVLSHYLPIDEEIWLNVIKENVPKKAVEANLKAFKIGREIGAEYAVKAK